MAIDDCQPCNCDPAKFVKTTQTFQITIARILCQSLAVLEAILVALGGGATPWAYAEETVTRTASSGAGTVAAGAYAATIANVGVANGTVLGVAIFPGQSLNFEAFTDEVTREVQLLPVIAFDGTGTTLHITRTAP